MTIQSEFYWSGLDHAAQWQGSTKFSTVRGTWFFLSSSQLQILYLFMAQIGRFIKEYFKVCMGWYNILI